MTPLRASLIAVPLLLCLITACRPSSPDYQSLLVGKWQDQRIYSKDKVETQTVILYSDGILEGFGSNMEDGKEFPFTFRATWFVKGDRFCYTSTYSNPPNVFPEGDSYKDQIVSVTATKWVMIEQSTGLTSKGTKLE